MEAAVNIWVAHWMFYASTLLALEKYGRTYPLTLVSPRKFNIVLFICQWGRQCNQGLNTPNEITEQVSGRAGIAVQEHYLSVTYLVSCLHFSGKVFLVTMLEVLTQMKFDSYACISGFILKVSGISCLFNKSCQSCLRENYGAQDYYSFFLVQCFSCCQSSLMMVACVGTEMYWKSPTLASVRVTKGTGLECEW